MRTSRSGESALLLLDVIERLVNEKIVYAVVGALAAAIHGAVRASLDADVLVSLTIEKATRLERNFATAGFTTELRRGDVDDPIPALLKLADRYDNRVDLLIGLRGMEPAAFTRVVEIPFQGETVKFIGPEDFIAMKVFAGGPLDVVDARRAILARGESLNRDLLRRLAANYGPGAVAALERALAT